MVWFNNLKVGVKLAFSFAVILVLMAFLGVFSSIKLAQVNNATIDMQENWLPSTRAGGDFAAATANYRRAELQHLLSVHDEEFATYEKSLADTVAALEKQKSGYEKLISGPEERKLYEAFIKSWEGYIGVSKRLIALSRGHENDEAKALARGESKRGRLRKRKIKHAKPVAAVAMA